MEEQISGETLKDGIIPPRRKGSLTEGYGFGQKKLRLMKPIIETDSGNRGKMLGRHIGIDCVVQEKRRRKKGFGYSCRR